MVKKCAVLAVLAGSWAWGQATMNWKGGSGTFGVPGNWVEGSVPGLLDTAVIMNNGVVPLAIQVDANVKNFKLSLRPSPGAIDLVVRPGVVYAVETNLSVEVNGTVGQMRSFSFSGGGRIEMSSAVQSVLAPIGDRSYLRMTLTNVSLEVLDKGGYWYIPRNGSGSVFEVGENGTCITPQVVCGDNSSAWSNQIVVAGANAFFDVRNQIRVGLAGRFNAMAVTNNGYAKCTQFTLGANALGAYNTLYVADGGVMEVTGSSGFRSGSAGSFNDAVIGFRGELRTVYDVFVGDAYSSWANRLRIDGGKATANKIWIGNNGCSNRVEIVGGGMLVVPGFSLGEALLATGNVCRVASGGVADVRGTLYVGPNGFGNRMYVESAGVVTSSVLSVGSSASGIANEMIVDGGSVVVTNQINYSSVGFNGNSNVLRITNGGQVRSGRLYAGWASTAKRNRIEVTGGGSLDVSNDILVGDQDGTSENRLLVAGTNTRVSVSGLLRLSIGASSGNALEIRDGGSVVAGSISVGYSEIATGYGSLSVSNATISIPNGTLTIRRSPALIGGTNEPISTRTFEFTQNAALTFAIPKEKGVSGKYISVTGNFVPDTTARIRVQAADWAARSGGKITLLQYGGVLDTSKDSAATLQNFVDTAVLDPATMMLSIGTDGKSLVLSSPRRDGTVLRLF